MLHNAVLLARGAAARVLLGRLQSSRFLPVTDAAGRIKLSGDMHRGGNCVAAAGVGGDRGRKRGEGKRNKMGGNEAGRAKVRRDLLVKMFSVLEFGVSKLKRTYRD